MVQQKVHNIFNFFFLLKKWMGPVAFKKSKIS